MIALPQRMLDKIMPVTESGCWIWMASHTKEGYGTTSWHGKQNVAHRVIWSIVNGPIPLGLHIDHLCRVRPCVNPAHMELVTQRENILRGVGPSAIHATKTQCPRGHAFTPENTFRQRVGHRIQRSCRECRRKACRDWYARNYKGKTSYAVTKIEAID